MGGGSSTQTNVTNVTSSVTNAMAQAIMNCSGNTMVEQKFTVSGSYNAINNFKMVQAMSLSATCANNAENLASVQAAVTAAVTAASSAQSVAGLSALTKSKADTNIRIQNDVTQNITSQTLTNVINSVNAVQTATISGDNNIISNFDEEQTLVIVQNACQSVVSQMKTVQEIASQADAKAEAKQTDPIDSFMKNINSIVETGFTGANTGFSIVAAVIIAGIIGGVILLHKFGGQILKMVPGAHLLVSSEKTVIRVGPEGSHIKKEKSHVKLPNVDKPAAQLPNLTFTKEATANYAVGAQPTQPTQPIAQPTQPVTQPVAQQPIAQPTQPTQPVTQPTQPVAQPVTQQPIAQPTQPVPQPDTNMEAYRPASQNLNNPPWNSSTRIENNKP